MNRLLPFILSVKSFIFFGCLLLRNMSKDNLKDALNTHEFIEEYST